MQRINDLLKRLKSYFTYDRILLLAIILCILLVNSCNQARNRKELDQERKSAKIWKDMYDNEHATVAQVVLQKEDMDKKVDSISEVLKIKPKTITKYVKAGFRVDTVVKGTTNTVLDTIWLDMEHYRIDTVKTLDFVDTSRTPAPLEIHAKGDSLSVKLDANLNFTDYWKRSKFLGLRIGKKTYYTDVTSDNKYLRFNGAESYQRVIKPKLKVRTGFGVGINLDPFTGKISPGIQMGVYLIKSQ